MNESSDHDVTAKVEHPDLDEANDWDGHGPVFEATFEGLEPTDDTAVADG